MADERIAETLALLQKVWTLFLIALYGVGFLDAYHFPGAREEPEEGEAILWNLQKVLFFALMGAGFLVDAVRMREDRSKAYQFLFLSLILGGIASFATGLQYKLVAVLFGK